MLGIITRHVRLESGGVQVFPLATHYVLSPARFGNGIRYDPSRTFVKFSFEKREQLLGVNEIELGLVKMPGCHAPEVWHCTDGSKAESVKVIFLRRLSVFCRSRCVNHKRRDDKRSNKCSRNRLSLPSAGYPIPPLPLQHPSTTNHGRGHECQFSFHGFLQLWLLCRE